MLAALRTLLQPTGTSTVQGLVLPLWTMALLASTSVATIGIVLLMWRRRRLRREAVRLLNADLADHDKLMDDGLLDDVGDSCPLSVVGRVHSLTPASQAI